MGAARCPRCLPSGTAAGANSPSLLSPSARQPRQRRKRQRRRQPHRCLPPSLVLLLLLLLPPLLSLLLLRGRHLVQAFRVLGPAESPPVLRPFSASLENRPPPFAFWLRPPLGGSDELPGHHLLRRRSRLRARRRGPLRGSANTGGTGERSTGEVTGRQHQASSVPRRWRFDDNTAPPSSELQVPLDDSWDPLEDSSRNTTDDDGAWVRQLALSQLIDELQRRKVRFGPGAGRPDLEAMLLLQNRIDDHPRKLGGDDILLREPQGRRTVIDDRGPNPNEPRTVAAAAADSSPPPADEPSWAKTTGATWEVPTSGIDLETAEGSNNVHGNGGGPGPDLDISVPASAPSADDRANDGGGEGAAEDRATSVSAPFVLPTEGVASLSELLGELRRIGVRFSPTSTRQELELLLVEARARRSPSDASPKVVIGAGGDEENSRREGRLVDDDPAPETHGQPTTTKKYETIPRPPRPFDENRWRSEAYSKRPRKRRPRQRRDVASPSSAWDWSSIPGAVEDAYSAAHRAVRTFQRKAAEAWAVDEDGVRDADFTYLYRDEDLYGRVRWLNDEQRVTAEATNTNKSYYNYNGNGASVPDETIQSPRYRVQVASDRRPLRDYVSTPSPSRDVRIRRPPSESAAPGPWEGRDPSRRTGRRSGRASNDRGTDPYGSSRREVDGAARQRRPHRPPARQGVFTKRPFLLPPARGSPPLASHATDSPTVESPTANSSPPTPTAPSERKIYSPYHGRDTLDEVGDGLDRLGKFVADVADRFMWGPNEDNDRGDKVGSAEDSSANRGGAESSNGSPKYRHWKDRLEAQFDSVLGIGEDGGYYRRWADKARQDKRDEGGHDPFSVARGVQPKRRGLSSPHPRNRRHDKPIWEEEGNLVALLFGRTQSGSSLLFEKLLDPNHGSLLFLLRAVFRSLLLVSSYVCRWASVRGAFPQPVVVIGVFSALVCAPRGRRTVAGTAALVFFRALGELAHGYAYGDDGWEDDAASADDDIESDGGKG